MSALLALGSAIVFGAGDFLGGLASRRIAPLQVTAVAQLASFPIIVPLLLLVPASNVTAADLGWGAVAGLFGMLGVLGLYTALGEGPMGVVAPMTAVLSAAIPVVYGLATGERPTVWTMVGMAIGLAAIVAVSASDGPSGRLSPRLLLMTLGAGLGFGLFFIMFGQTGLEAGMWPLLGARAVSAPVALGLVLTVGGGLAPGRAWRIAFTAGALDMVANALFLASAQRGLLSIAAVLAALYPAVTALLARAVLAERMSPPQLLGVGAALVAVILIAAPI